MITFTLLQNNLSLEFPDKLFFLNLVTGTVVFISGFMRRYFPDCKTLWATSRRLYISVQLHVACTH